MFELLSEYGVRQWGRRCDCCDDVKLYAISYSPGYTVLICARCDVAFSERDLS